MILWNKKVREVQVRQLGGIKKLEELELANNGVYLL